MTIVGVLMLLGGYTLSFFVADPRMTLHILAAAVLFVILGTYFIFIAAIIAFLRLLKKNKRFYYKTKHFMSFSGLIYRMKRNCVGLASVTILSTMVLISVSSTSSLMLGIDIQLTDGDAVIVTCNDYNGEVASGIEKDILERVKPDRIEKYLMAKMYLKGRKDHNFVPLEKGEYEDGGSYIYVIPGYDGGIKSEDKVTLTVQAYDSIDTRYLGDREEDVLFKKDPADIKKEYYTEKGEIVIESKDRSFDNDRFEFFGSEYKVRKYVYNKDGTEDGVRITVATNEEVQEFIDAFNKASLFRSSEFHTMEIYYKQPIPDSDRELKDVLKDKDTNSLINGKTYLDPTRYRSEEKAGMMLAFGSLFFLGVFLGTLFVLETVLIIYYKQLTEGYEDAGRFRIMQNVGMSEDEVRSTIRSQILLVFFLPLVFAMLHTVIAFPMVGRLLAYIGLDSTKTYLKSCAIGFAGYFVLYTAVYLLTAKLYYRIIRKQR